jgi:hypothetical protein
MGEEKRKMSEDQKMSNILVEAPAGSRLEFVDWASSCVAKTSQGCPHKCCDRSEGKIKSHPKGE